MVHRNGEPIPPIVSHWYSTRIFKEIQTVQENEFNFFNEACCSDVCHSFHPSLSHRKMPRTQLRGSAQLCRYVHAVRGNFLWEETLWIIDYSHKFYPRISRLVYKVDWFAKSNALSTTFANIFWHENFPFIAYIVLMNMLCAKYGSGQSMDCAAQSMDPCFAQQSMDCLLNPWIAQTRDSKYGSRPNHWCMDAREKRRSPLTFATQAPPAAMLLNMIVYSLILASKYVYWSRQLGWDTWDGYGCMSLEFRL